MALRVTNGNGRGQLFGNITSPQRTSSPQQAATVPGNFTQTVDPNAGRYTLSYGGSSAAGGNNNNNTMSGNNVAAPQAAPVDPYAKWGGKAGYDQVVADYGNAKNGVFSSINERIANDALTYDKGVDNFAYELGDGQKLLNERGVQNELSKRLGTQSVYDMVGRGINSAGTVLANNNASTSSAGEAIARAYGEIGQKELSSVGSQYALEDRNINMAQESFDGRMTLAAQNLDRDKNIMVNSIVSEAGTKIDALNAKAAGASLPDRINIENEKARIRAEALGKLSAFDTEIQAAREKNKPSDSKSRAQQAAELAQRGSVAQNPFDFSTDVPAEFQNTGPWASDLPLFYTGRNKNKQNA